MRCHALSSQRKFNRHWQSAGNKASGVWYNFGTVGTEKYFCAPFYKWPSFPCESIMGSGVSIRGIDTNALISLMSATQYSNGRNGYIYTSEEKELIPSIGPLYEDNFDLYYYENNTLNTLNIDLEEKQNLIIPVYDFIFFSVENSQDIGTESIELMKDCIQSYLSESITLPTGFVPKMQAIDLPDTYFYGGDVYAEARILDPSQINANVHVLGQNGYWGDLLKRRWGDFLGVSGGTALTTSEGSLAFVKQNNDRYQWDFSEIGNYMPVIPISQLEPVYTVGGGYFTNLKSANYGLAGFISTMHKQENKTITLQRYNSNTENVSFTKTYNGGIAPYNFYTSCWSPDGVYTYAFVTRLKRLITRKEYING